MADQKITDVPAVTVAPSGSLIPIADITNGTRAIDIDDLEVQIQTGVVMENDYTPAHSLLVQQSGTGSPSSLSVPNDTILGRLSGGGSDIDALTTTEVRTLINVANGATANSPDATLLNRANHTGTQLAVTISDFSSAVAATAAVTANTAKVTNATHTGDVTGATALTLASVAITGKTSATIASGDSILFSDVSDSGNLKKTTAADLVLSNAPSISGTLDCNNQNIQEVKTATFNGEIDDGNSSTADTIDWGAGNNHRSTLTGNCTYTFTAPAGVGYLSLKLIQDGTGSRTATWPAAVKWPGNTAPTLTTTANRIDIVTFYYDGTSYFGAFLGDYT
jgi:hypothetical protein